MKVVSIQRGAKASFSPFPVRLVTDQMALRAWVRREIQPQAMRLAACYWWPTHSVEDAQVELRLATLRFFRAARFADVLSPSARAFTDSVLQNAIEQMGELHDASFETLRSVAAGARRAGASSVQVAQATVKVARTMMPLPPPWLVREAIDGSKPASASTTRWSRRRPPAQLARHHA